MEIFTRIMKKIIWLIGSSASGKTTQSKLIHKNLNNTIDKITHEVFFTNTKYEDDVTYFTTFDRTSHVGKVEDTQCTGTDSLNTRDRIEMSYLSLMFQKNVEIILVDGIMATSLWSEMIHQVKTNHKIHSILILLNYDSPEANFARLKQRRANKTGQPVESIELSENTQSNVASKLKGFKNMYEKVKGDFNVAAEINADLPADKIHQMILQYSGL